LTITLVAATATCNPPNLGHIGGTSLGRGIAASHKSVDIAPGTEVIASTIDVIVGRNGVS
jgi:hypothetical protein